MNLFLLQLTMNWLYRFMWDAQLITRMLNAGPHNCASSTLDPWFLSIDSSFEGPFIQQSTNTPCHSSLFIHPATLLSLRQPTLNTGVKYFLTAVTSTVCHDMNLKRHTMIPCTFYAGNQLCVFLHHFL